MEGPEAATGYAMTFIRAFPDVRLTVENTVVSGDWVACEMSFEGTHEGPLEGPEGSIPPTNRRVTGKGAEFIRFQDVKVVEERLYYDQMDFLGQLGVMEPQVATA